MGLSESDLRVSEGKRQGRLSGRVSAKARSAALTLTLPKPVRRGTRRIDNRREPFGMENLRKE